MIFEDNDFVTWYQNISQKEQKEVWKEIEKHIEEECEKLLQSLSEGKDIKLKEPFAFTIKKIENLIYSKHKTERE